MMTSSVLRRAVIPATVVCILLSCGLASGNSRSIEELNSGKWHLKTGQESFRRQLYQATPGTGSSSQVTFLPSTSQAPSAQQPSRAAASPPPPASTPPPPPGTSNSTTSTVPASNGTRIAPAPAATNVSSTAPAPAPAQRAPAPAPGLQRTAPAPAPRSGPVPAPAPGPGPVPAPAPGTAPVPAPLSAPVPSPSTPGPAPQQAPVPAPQSAPVPSPSLAPVPAPQAAVPSPSVLSPAPAPGTTPESSLLAGGILSAGSSPSPAPEVSSGSPALAPQGPGPFPESVTPAPAIAPQGVVSFPAPSPQTPAPAPSLATQAVAPTPGPSTQGLVTGGAAGGPTSGVGIGAPSAPGSGPAASIPSAALTPQGLLAPQTGPSLGPSLAPALGQIYPASALAPAAPGQASTLVTIPATATGAAITQLDPSSGQIETATPQTLSRGGELFARPGEVSFIVQTSTALPSLPANAVNVEGGTVASTSPVQGSNGQLFNVNVNTAAGASFLTIGTVAGVGLANGLLTTSSNTVRVTLVAQNPQTTITSGQGYNSGQTVLPSFTIDFGGRVTQENPEVLYTLTGTDRTDVVYDYGNGRIFIMAYILPEQDGTATNIVINVAAGVTTDLAGNPNSAASYTWSYRPKSPSYTTVSNVANGVSGGSLALALAAPIVLGTATTGAASAAVAAAGTFYMLHILSSLQYVYLAGRMNVANLPPNFRQVSDSLSWTVLDFRAPWETARGNHVSQQQANTGFPSTPTGISTSGFGPQNSGLFSVTGRRRLQADHPLHRMLIDNAPALAPIGATNGTFTVPNIAGGSSQYVVTSTGLNKTDTSATTSASTITDLSQTVSTAALGNGDDPYETVWRSLFWLGLGLIALTITVYGAVAFFLYKRWGLPVILQSPRPQIMLLMFGVPAIAQSSAGLFADGDGKAIAVGVVIVCFLPFLMVLYAAWFVWRHILPHEGRRAAWILTEDPEHAHKESSCWSRVLDVVVGPQGSEGSWMALKRRDSRFVNQYGPLFEVNRGPPMVLTDVTYEVDPETGFCNRGRLQQAYEAPIFKLGRLTLYPYHLQGQNSGLELLMGIATAILLQSFTQPSSYAQVIILICLNVFLLVWLRLIRPAGDRTELIMTMIGCLSTLGIYICGLILLANPDASDGFRSRIGIAMIVLGLWSVVTFILGLIAFIVTTFNLWLEFRNWAFPSKDPARKFANVVYDVMAKDEHLLARKFGDRWLYKALGSGLHGRAIHRKEKGDPRKRLYKAVLLTNHLQRGRQAKKPARLGQGARGQHVPSTGYGPSPAQSVGALQWPGMAQMNKLKSRQDSQQNLIGSEADQSPNQLLNTGDLTPNDVGTSGDNSPGSSPGDIAENDNLGVDDFQQGKKVHAAAPQTSAIPLGSRQNQAGPPNRDASRPDAEPHVVIDFEAEAAPQSPPRTRSPSRRRSSEPARQYRSDDKENR